MELKNPFNRQKKNTNKSKNKYNLRLTQNLKYYMLMLHFLTGNSSLLSRVHKFV